jgi:hypothetical protein
MNLIIAAGAAPVASATGKPAFRGTWEALKSKMFGADECPEQVNKQQDGHAADEYVFHAHSLPHA